MTLINRLNVLVREHACRTNPNGYFDDDGEPPPATVEGYRHFFAKYDQEGEPIPVRYRGSSSVSDGGLDIPAYLAWHDREHVALGIGFGLDDELRVSWKQYEDMLLEDRAAASLHLLIACVTLHYWHLGGEGRPPNIAGVIDVMEQRLRKHGTILRLGRNRSPQETLAFFQEHAGDDFLAIARGESALPSAT